MNIALVGATGQIGRHIAAEALRRGHRLTALLRRPPAEALSELAGAELRVVELADGDAFAAAVRGSDVVASAYGPGSLPAEAVTEAIVGLTRTLIAGTRAAGVPRLVVVGGAGSLEVAPGVQLVDTPSFPAAYKPYAIAHREALAVLRAADDLAWTFFAPAAEIGPGERRGAARTGVRALLVSPEGRSQISYADYAIAFVDELERAAHPREVITAAY